MFSSFASIFVAQSLSRRFATGLVGVAAAVLFGAVGAPVAVADYDNGSVPVNTAASARRLINDLLETHGEKGYPKGREFLARLDKLEKSAANPSPSNSLASKANADALQALIREAALANPILDFDKILLVRRMNKGEGGFTKLNSHCEDDIRRDGWDNELMLLSNLRGAKPRLTSLYRPPNTGILRDLDLHFDADRLLFAATNPKHNEGDWAVFEKSLSNLAAPPRRLTPDDQPGIQWFDPCYLPEEGAILAFSTAGVQGVPCEGGGNKSSSLYRIDGIAKKPAPTAAGVVNPDYRVRQLTFEQDSGWHPRPLHDGRIAYLRWQYTDTPHYFDRILFTMLPDGRQQKALWGSGAYFPTAFKQARPVPGHPSMLVGIAGSHHGKAEQGRLLLVDPNLGTHYPFRHKPASKDWGPEGSVLEITPQVFPASVTGCVQEIPGWGRDVVGTVKDDQGSGQRYTFAFPYPLNEKYFLTSLREKGGESNFSLYLVDRFDNFVKLLEVPNSHLLEATPLVRRPRPPVIPDDTAPRIKPGAPPPPGAMLIADVHEGRGLPGIPRGVAKSLRIIAYHFAYWKRGGHDSVGEHSAWDVKRVLGTVPIEADGSAFFQIPSNTPIAIQVLDANGAAIQLMRSWTIAMPGETVSCTGCHEPSNVAASPRRSLAALKPPRVIIPFHGPVRPFGYQTEIQPILNRLCLPCHNAGSARALRLPDFTPPPAKSGLVFWRKDPSYLALNPYLHRPGPESFIETLVPMEFHANTSELIQRLRRGHHGVEKKLTKADWERLYTWIDLNAPHRGGWDFPELEQLRLRLQHAYQGNPADPEADNLATWQRLQKNPVPLPPSLPIEKIRALYTPNQLKELEAFEESIAAADSAENKEADNNPAATVTATTATAAPTAPIAAPKRPPPLPPRAAAKAEPKPGTLRELILPDGSPLRFRYIPAGTTTIGNNDGQPDERPATPVRIAKGYWMAETEITNAQYALFDPDHDTGYNVENGKDHVAPGHIANHPDQPVSRVSWQRALAYCAWLARQTRTPGITLPTEAQWEHATRAGTTTHFYFGPRHADFSPHANLADAGLRRTDRGFPGGSRLAKRTYFTKNHAYPLRDHRYEDKWFTVDYVKQYAPNPWGLHDTIGNVAEWTRTAYAPYPYPYRDNDGRNALPPDSARELTDYRPRVVRGGSHSDRPTATGSATRLPYPPYQRPSNVGFRPIIEM